MSVNSIPQGIELSPVPYEEITDAPFSPIIEQGGIINYGNNLYGKDICARIAEAGLSTENLIKFLDDLSRMEGDKNPAFAPFLKKKLNGSENIRNTHTLLKNITSINKEAKIHPEIISLKLFENIELIRILIKFLFNPELVKTMQKYSKLSPDFGKSESFSTINNWIKKQSDLNTPTFPLEFAKKVKMKISTVLPYCLPESLEEIQSKYDRFFELPKIPKDEKGNYTLKGIKSSVSRWEMFQNLFDTNIRFTTAKEARMFFELNYSKYPVLESYLGERLSGKIINKNIEEKIIIELKKFQAEFLPKLQK